MKTGRNKQKLWISNTRIEINSADSKLQNVFDSSLKLFTYCS